MRLPLLPTILGWLLAASTASSSEPGEALIKTDLLGVFAHPDDETGMAPTLAYYAHGRGARIAHIYCTRGEGGGNMVGTQAGHALGALREFELNQCLDLLGIRHVRFLDQLDWAYTESAAATLEKWGKETTLERLVRLIRVFRPEVILTMNPAPTPGQHGHHQSAGILATEAFDAAADPARFTSQLTKEGLRPWQTRRLFYSGAGEPGSTIEVSAPLADGRTPAQIAGKALSHHRSQAFGDFSNSPWLQRPQHFALVKSLVPSTGIETNLLAGLPIGDSSLHPRHAPPQPAAPRFDMQFQPRPAFERYQRWTREHRLEHWAQRYKADLPIIAGQANEIRVNLNHSLPSPVTGVLEIQTPAGWRVDPHSHSVTLTTGKHASFTFRVTPPPGFTMDAEISASWKSQGFTTNVPAIAHPLPSLRVPKLRPLPDLHSSINTSATPAVFTIASTSLVQGKATGDADNSASVRIAHDGTRLWIEVKVLDDVVVSNILPDDIRGHWRSDSVEICLDPNPGSEHTLGCYKIGVFPFDTTGKVRAARDADALQGPIEETAPGTRLASEKIPGGYIIRASIPFSEIGLPKRSKRLGFNVIVYDGDKPNAAVGANINESRIAWAPRPGVMGRPEDWGRLELD